MPKPSFSATSRIGVAFLFTLGACSGSDSGLVIGNGGSATAGGSGSIGGNSVASVGGAASSTLGGNSALGGATNAGGASNGATGGTTSGVGGGQTTGGAFSAGGVAQTGGTTAKGGSSNGGSNLGGAATGGGAPKGGTTSGGTAAGGSMPKGGTTTGGNATGGNATGGTATGGASKGGTATGGAAIGGAATGGSTGAETPGLRIVGRTATGTAAGAVRFSWPGVNIRGRFTGTQVSMDAIDSKNRFTVVIDGGTPKTVTGTSATSLSLATGLASGNHDIVVWRNTEAGMGVTQFTGLSNFGTGGALLAPAAAPDRRIEVIGDSLSVGAGNEGNATCTGGIDAFTNNYLAYGSVAARTVGADVVTIAWSGIGVYRNSDGGTSNVMPTRYPYAVPNDSSAWDFTKYQPHVVVMNLGTNDFGSGDPGTAYETAYVSFIKTVRSKYASANFILIDMYGGNRLTRINNVISTLKSGGESKVEMLSFSSTQNNTGCNQHPNVASHAAMGGVLATRLKSLMGW